MKIVLVPSVLASILISITAAWSARQLSFLHPTHRSHSRCLDLGHQHRISMTHRRKPKSFLERSSSSQDDDESNDTAPQPPVAFRDESSVVLAGDVGDNTTRQSASSPHPLLSPPRAIPNPYGWLRDESRTNATVLNHLHAENEYTRQMTEHLSALREEIYREFLSSIKETDYTVPVARGKCWYYSRMNEGVSYPRYCRAPRSKGDLYPPPTNENWSKHRENSTMEPLLPGEEIYLDVPLIARNKTYLAVGVIAISPNDEYVAYTLDETGDEVCHFYVRHIASGKEWVLHDADGRTELLQGYGAVVWDESSSGIFYATMDEAHRPYQVYYRRLFTSDGSYILETERQSDELLLEERDGVFHIHIEKTFDSKYLLITCSSAESNKIHYLDLKPENSPELPMASRVTSILQAEDKVRYRVTHCKGYWLMQTNLGHLPNLILRACAVGKESDADNWKDVLLTTTGTPVFDGGEKASLDGITIFDPQPASSCSTGPFAYGVATGREDGLPRVWVLEFRLNKEITESRPDAKSLSVPKITRLEFDETAFDVSLGDNQEPKLPYAVVTYNSLVTPHSHIAVPLANPTDLNARKVLKEIEVPGYDKNAFACERTSIKSRDGDAYIPVSLVYRRDVFKGNVGSIPTHLYGYGAYGASIEASFCPTRLALLNRGVVYAIAHVRGGGEMGRPWYDRPWNQKPSGAKYLCKRNSFNDFIDVANWLTGNKHQSSELNILDRKYDSEPGIFGEGITNPEKLSCEGMSAGGLLIGAAINQAPHLFRAALMKVPFVDVLCTMTDATLPLTIAEWEEWGNPNEEIYFNYISSYSPINNIGHRRVYPGCLLTGGLHDPRVQYWEPAKFTSELRHQIAENSGKVLLKMDMDAGHGSGSDRYKYLRELSFEYAFLLDELGLAYHMR